MNENIQVPPISFLFSPLPLILCSELQELINYSSSSSCQFACINLCSLIHFLSEIFLTSIFLCVKPQLRLKSITRSSAGGLGEGEEQAPELARSRMHNTKKEKIEKKENKCNIHNFCRM